jgi:hypothetical protein
MSTGPLQVFIGKIMCLLPRSKCIHTLTCKCVCIVVLTLFDPTSDLVRQYDFPVLLRCRKSSYTVFVAFVRPLSEPVRRFSSCSTDFNQQIA